MLKVRGPLMAQALSGDKNGPVTVNVATMRKDVRTMLDQGQSTGRAMPLTALALQQLDAAAASGLDGADCAQYPVWWLARRG
jgi:3-hydroxyisobutyrate dehydrogenase